MNIRRALADFVVVFTVSLIVSAAVTLLSNRIVHGINAIDWETSLRSAILFAIIFTWIGNRNFNNKSNAV